MANQDKKIDMDQIQREVEDKKELWTNFFAELVFESIESEDPKFIVNQKIQHASMVAQMMLEEVEKRWQ